MSSRLCSFLEQLFIQAQLQRIIADIFTQASFETLEIIKLSFSYFINITAVDWRCV